jgi:thioredoxin-related protein
MSKLTFTDEEVGKVTDQYFIAYKVDAEKGEGITIAEKYKVNAYPTVLFFNTDGKQIGKEKGMMDVEKFLYVLEKYLKKASK